MKFAKLYGSLIAWVFALGACVEPYDPPLQNEDVNYLVVDGFLNVTESVATVKITRSLPVKSSSPVSTVTDAIVRVEDDNGLHHYLSQVSPGIYEGVVTNADTDTGYRLFIHTNGHEYLSDYIQIPKTPPIDSITYSIARDGVEFAVTTHDPSGSARNYRWKYLETFEYHANYNSNYMVTSKGEVVQRPTDLEALICWKTNPSTDILIASTKHLSEAIVSKHPITLIPFGSMKLTVEYSIRVQQQALDDEAYEYWLNLEQSTEHLGGLFDPLPAEVSGNIRSTNHPGEVVIGFFSGSEISETRIFVKRSDLPEEVISRFRNPYCALDTILNADLPSVGPGTMLVDAIYPPLGPGGPIGYTYAENICVDCTVQGGTTQKPPFWK
jgi:hypothetical protein